MITIVTSLSSFVLMGLRISATYLFHQLSKMYSFALMPSAKSLCVLVVVFP
jgi:hypothetical protein